MKNIIFIVSILSLSTVNAKQIVIDISDQDEMIIENDVTSVEAWLQSALAGKVAKCRSRIVQSEIKRAMNNASALPSGGERKIVENYLSSPRYKNRKQRDLEQQ